jgi:transcriptional regulator with XRE-family HTH domain
MDFGSRLSAWLAIRGLSKSALAKKIGVSRAAVTAWARHGKLPGHKNMTAILGVLGITLDEFFGAPPQTKAAA